MLRFLHLATLRKCPGLRSEVTGILRHGTNHLIPKLKTTFVSKSSVKLNNAVDSVFHRKVKTIAVLQKYLYSHFILNE